jgi:cyclomaltodextrinase
MSIVSSSQFLAPAASARPSVPSAPLAPAAPSSTTGPALSSTPKPSRGQGITQAAAGVGNLQIPDWVKDAVFYQIFPERFENGDPGNDPRGTAPWGSKPTNDGMMGGDLQGVTKRIGYLKSLGVNALYFNPIFSSPSNHKYNITDYEHVDPQFGGDAAFKDMVDAAHTNGVKVMLDGVFNHTSHQNKWFQDVRDNGPKSQYFDRYTVNNWPISYYHDKDNVLRSNDYKSWFNYAELPELKTDNPKVRDYFLTGKDSIVKRWIRDGHIDGWRMDVADDSNFSPDYWRTARQAIKSTNPDAYMVAENWHDASSMLQGDQFDGAMNYNYFTFPSVDFFAKKTATPDQFVQRLQNSYSPEAKFGMFNILDSHDTARFITQAGGDWYRQRPAAIFQMTYVGAPVVYYGDELGMEGAADPDSRRAMTWDLVPGNKTKDPGSPTGALDSASNGQQVSAAGRADQLFSLYQKLIETRKQVPALRRGDFSVLATHNENDTLVYRRAIKGEQQDAIVALNNNVVGRDIHVPLKDVAPDGTKYTDALTGSSYTVANGAIDLSNVDGNFGAVLLRDV